MAKPWLKLWTETIRDRKLRRISPDMRWCWIALLCLAGESDQEGRLQFSPNEPMTDDDFADGCGIDLSTWLEAKSYFLRMGMIELEGQTVHICAWQKRQASPDPTAAQRMREWRERNVTRNETVTLQNLDTVTVTQMLRVEAEAEAEVDSKESSVVKSERAHKAPPHTPKTKTPKPPAEPPPPAIQALHEIVGIYPPKETWDALIAACKGKTKSDLQAVYTEFRLRTPNKHNWTWVTDGVRSYSGKPNGKAPPNGLPSPETLWGTVQAEIDRVHYSGTPELPAQILTAIQAVGGWYNVCHADPDGPLPARLRDAYKSVIHA